MHAVSVCTLFLSWVVLTVFLEDPFKAEALNPAPPLTGSQEFLTNMKLLRETRDGKPFPQICEHLRKRGYMLANRNFINKPQACLLLKYLGRRAIIDAQRPWQGEAPAEALWSLLQELVKKSEASDSVTVIDVGANVGQSVLSWSMLSNSVTFHLFEALPQNIDYLQLNFASMPNVYIQQTAVGNTAGTETFLAPEDPKDLSQQGRIFRVAQPVIPLVYRVKPELMKEPIAPMPIPYGWKKIQVPINELDALMANISDADLVRRGESLVSPFGMIFLKTTTNGFDHLVLLGAKRLLSHVTMVLWECGSQQLASNGGPGTSHRDTQRFLRTFNMATFKLSTVHWIRFDGRYYHEFMDFPANMGPSTCFSIRKDHPLYRRLLSRIPSCVPPSLYDSCDAGMVDHEE